MTVLHQDIGDTSGGLGGDTSAARLGRWLPMNPSIPVSASRSRSGLTTRPRGAVSTFCAEHGISRKSFYELRKRAKADGPAAVLEPRSRRPRSSPSKLSEEVKEQALQVRAALEASGLDHGPISVHDKMHAMGLDAGALDRRRWRGSSARPASLGWSRRRSPARRGGGSSTRRRTRAGSSTRPSTCSTGGRKCVIFQLIDDHSRYAVASHVASGETAEAAITVFDKAVAAHGVPATAAVRQRARAQPVAARVPRPARRRTSSRLGVEAITGKPYKPTTQGKNERFHQTLFRYLDKQPLAEHAGRTAGPGRRVRPHLQHRTPPPRTARPRHAR